jgi:predicted nucleic acid-binding protein
MRSEGRLELLNSFALEYENGKNPNIENMLKISGLLGYSTDYMPYDKGILDRSLEFEKYGLMGMDAVHVACAEKAKAYFFITCDDDFIKKLERIDNIGVVYYNVIDFVLREVFKI